MLMMIQIDAKQASHQQVRLIEDIRKYYPLVYKEQNIAVTFLRGICTAKGLEIMDKNRYN